MYSLSKQEAPTFLCGEILVLKSRKWEMAVLQCHLWLLCLAWSGAAQMIVLDKMQTVVQQNGSRISWVASCAEVPAHSTHIMTGKRTLLERCVLCPQKAHPYCLQESEMFSPEFNFLLLAFFFFFFSRQVSKTCILTTHVDVPWYRMELCFFLQ